MQEKLQVNVHWLRKAVICLAFFGFLSAKDARAYGVPPLISVPPVGITVQSGGTITLTSVIGVSLTPLTVKWLYNGNEVTNAKIVTSTLPIVGTTTTTLTLTNASSALAGNYAVQAENFGGTNTSGNAIVIVVMNLLSPVTILTSQCGLTNGGFQLQLLKPAQSNCVIEATGDFVHWIPINTNTSGSTNFSYLDSAATNLSRRYYRARLQ
jgi:Immunoglobulin domain